MRETTELGYRNRVNKQLFGTGLVLLVKDATAAGVVTMGQSRGNETQKSSESGVLHLEQGIRGVVP